MSRYAEGVGVGVGVGEGTGVVVAEGVGVGVGEPDSDGVGVGVGVSDAEGGGEAEGIGVEEGDGVGVGVADTTGASYAARCSEYNSSKTCLIAPINSIAGIAAKFPPPIGTLKVRPAMEAKFTFSLLISRVGSSDILAN